MTTVLLSRWTDAFCGVWNEHAFRHRNPAFGSSRIASSAYQKWPTRSRPFFVLRSLFAASVVSPRPLRRRSGPDGVRKGDLSVGLPRLSLCGRAHPSTRCCFGLLPFWRTFI